jgi:hypothetical protein
VVYYHPEEPGPYPDGAAAFADVPTGGTFVLGSATYDVAEEGRLVAETEINIRGTGWYIRSGKPHRYYGSVLVNTGGDAIDKPVIECDLEPPDENNKWARQNTFRDFAVDHEGDAPGIRVKNYIFNTFDNCAVECNEAAPKGVSFEESGFFTRMLRCQVSGATDICVHVSGVGYAHEFYSNHIRTNAPEATAALQTERQRTIVVGGECASKAGSSGDADPEDVPAAIRFYNPGEDGVQNGGLVVEPGFEHTSRLEIDGKAPFNAVHATNIKLPTSYHGGAVPTVLFGNTDNSKVINPVIKRNQGHLVKWSELSSNCGIVTDAASLAGLEYTDQGAHNPYIQLNGAATETQLRAIPTGVPTTVNYNADREAPMFHTGREWRQVASRATTLEDD